MSITERFFRLVLAIAEKALAQARMDAISQGIYPGRLGRVLRESWKTKQRRKRDAAVEADYAGALKP